MQYFNRLKQQSLALKETTPGWMHAIQERGRAQGQSQIWPGRKTEAWRYTSLKKIENAQFEFQEAVSGKQELDTLIKNQNIVIENAIQILVVDGQVLTKPEDFEVVKGLTISAFDKLSEEQGRELAEKLGSVMDIDKHLFAVQSESLLNKGIYIKLEKNTRVVRPICIFSIRTKPGQSIDFRLFVDLEEGAEACVLEHFITAENFAANESLENTCTELSLARSSKLKHIRLNMQHEHSLHIGGVHSVLAANSELESFYAATGTNLTRIDVGVKHSGEGASSKLLGIYLPKNSQHVDFHTNLEHCVPQTRSEEIFRGIVSDSARAVFNGRIHIHPKAQKTDAKLSNKNLLTSTKAEVDSKPELEIYANDVQCAHGATVARLDEASLHYMRTRGVSEAEARVMLSFGFINELIEMLPLDEVAAYLLPRLAKGFTRDPELSLHLP